MKDPLSHLDPPSLRTVHAFMDATLQHSADGMRNLFAKDCEFLGALSGGPLRGRVVIESHYRQAFKGIGARGVTVLNRTEVRERQIVFEWEIVDPTRAEVPPAQGRTTLDLDASGLIARIKTEWNPREILAGRR
jgi:hypothetical protein